MARPVMETNGTAPIVTSEARRLLFAMSDDAQPIHPASGR